MKDVSLLTSFELRYVINKGLFSFQWKLFNENFPLTSLNTRSKQAFWPQGHSRVIFRILENVGGGQNGYHSTTFVNYIYNYDKSFQISQMTLKCQFRSFFIQRVIINGWMWIKMGSCLTNTAWKTTKPDKTVK